MLPLISFTNNGFYCKQANVYIDPIRPVDNAIITHAHSDHARWGSKHYLCHTLTRPLLQLRLGNNDYETLDWGQRIYKNGVEISLHPSGHIIGASQVRLSYKGEIWVISGDYKLENDGISGTFEPIKCHHFISESTFGLPIYRWKPQIYIYNQMANWALANSKQGITSVFIAYSLGKAQRVLQALAPTQLPIYAHGAIVNVQDLLHKCNLWQFPQVQSVGVHTQKEQLKGSIVIAPPSAENTQWLNRFNPYQLAVCSGWMQVRGNARRQNTDAGFVLSDHADWEGLLTAIKATKAEHIWLTHGFQSVLTRYLIENGFNAQEVPPFWLQATQLTDVNNVDDERG